MKVATTAGRSYCWTGCVTGSDGRQILPVRLVLAGGGHAHLEILRRLILEPHPNISFTVVSAAPKQHYSGMVPGFLAGTYSEEAIAFDLPALSRRAEGQFLEARVLSIDPPSRVLRLSDARQIGYDLVSFSIGSGTSTTATPGVREHAHLVKPIHRATAIRGALLELGRGSGAARVVIVGAGAAGVEIACAAAAVLDRAGRSRQVTMIDSGQEILAGYTPRFRRRARRVLEKKGFALLLKASVAEVRSDSVRLADGPDIPSDLTIWLTGAAPQELFAGSGLPLDANGYLLVDDSLRCVGDPRVFGAGDCVTLASYPDTPKAGVYAVREGPVLWKSIVAAVRGLPPPHYKPQDGFLSILNTADSHALLQYGQFVSRSRWAWLLKDRIDRRFMRRYQDLVNAAKARAVAAG